MPDNPGSSVASPEQAGSWFAFDVVGVGALNLDYVASNPGMPGGRPFTRRLAELLGRESLEWGVEHQVDSVIGLSVIRHLDSLRIDSRHVRQDAERLCGICFSYSEDGDRIMLTHIITDAPPESAAIRELRARQVEVITTDPGPGLPASPEWRHWAYE